MIPTDTELIMQFRRAFYHESERENKLSPSPFWVCHLCQNKDGTQYVWLQQASDYQDACDKFWEYRMRINRPLVVYSEILAK